MTHAADGSHCFPLTGNNEEGSEKLHEPCLTLPSQGYINSPASQELPSGFLRAIPAADFREQQSHQAQRGSAHQGLRVDATPTNT